MKHKVLFSSLIILSVILLTACPSPTSGTSSNPPVPDDPVLTDNEDLFIPSGTVTLFSTNVFEFGAGQGATYWTEAEGAVPDFYSFTVKLNKISGYSLGGFGVFFSQRDCGKTSFSALAVFINTVGEYCIGLIENQTFTYMKDWTDCTYLHSGYNLKNSVTVEEVNPGEYSLSFNGSEVLDFKDYSDEPHTGGGFGYLAVVSPLENFPSIPVKVDFEKQP